MRLKRLLHSMNNQRIILKRLLHSMMNEYRINHRMKQKNNENIDIWISIEIRIDSLLK